MIALICEDVVGTYRARPAKRWAPGLVKFVAAVACYFCLALLAAFTQPREQLSAEPCTRKGPYIKDVRTEGGRGVGPKADIVREVA